MEQPRTQELVPGRTGQLRTQELEWRKPEEWWNSR